MNKLVIHEFRTERSNHISRERHQYQMKVDEQIQINKTLHLKLKFKQRDWSPKKSGAIRRCSGEVNKVLVSKQLSSCTLKFQSHFYELSITMCYKLFFYLVLITQFIQSKCTSSADKLVPLLLLLKYWMRCNILACLNNL